MTSALLLALCFISGQWPGPVPPTVFQPRPGAEHVIDLVPASNPPDAGNDAASGQKRFVESFNHLTETMAEFAEQYNHRHTIDVKKLRALKKAWRDLEKSEPWFKAR